MNYLKEVNEDTLMIVGLQTNFCIDATVKSAFERGYKVIIPKDTNTTFDNEYMDEKPSPSGSITSKIARSGFSVSAAAIPSFILADLQNVFL